MENQIQFNKETGVLKLGADYLLDKPSSFFYKEFPTIKEIIVEEENPHYSSSDGVLFSKNKDTLIMYPSQKDNNSYHIPEDVKYIEDNAFYYNTNINTIKFPDNLEAIGKNSFIGNWEVEKVYLPDSLHSLDCGSFRGCINLTSINIPSKIKEIPPLTFSNCYSLKNIDLSDTNVEKIGWGAFSGCNNIQEVTLNNAVSHIGEAAFEGNKSLTKISIPENTTFIGQDAFLNCHSLENIEVDTNNNIYTSNEGVLYTADKRILIKYPENKKDSEFQIPKEVEKLNQFSMSNLKNAKRIVLNENIESIPVGAFSESKKLERIESNQPLFKIGHLSFSDCSNLNYIHLSGDADAKIGKFAFSGCDSLTLDKIKVTTREQTLDKEKPKELEL